jgi:hypothetical protein
MSEMMTEPEGRIHNNQLMLAGIRIPVESICSEQQGQGMLMNIAELMALATTYADRTFQSKRLQRNLGKLNNNVKDFAERMNNWG